MFGPYTKQQQNPEIAHLEDELEREREARRQRDDDERERREERMRERQNMYEYEARTAQTWPEALNKQARLTHFEAKKEAEENFQLGSFFTDSMRGCERAAEIWPDVAASKQEKLAELQKQIEAVQTEIRLEVAEKLRSENDSHGWQSIADSIEEDTDLDNWLNW